MDYFMPPTCRACNGMLDSDGKHWASGRRACFVRQRAKCDTAIDTDAQSSRVPVAEAGERIVWDCPHKPKWGRS